MPKRSRANRKEPANTADLSAEWWLENMPPSIKGPGPYAATIAATDAINGRSGCAWEVRENGSTSVLHSQGKQSRSAASDEQRGYVAGTVGAIAALEGPADLTISSNSEYVTNALNGGAQRWKDNGWLGANRKPIKNRELWELVLLLLDQRMIVVKGSHVPKDDHIPYDRVMALAKLACKSGT